MEIVFMTAALQQPGCHRARLWCRRLAHARRRHTRHAWRHRCRHRPATAAPL